MQDNKKIYVLQKDLPDGAIKGDEYEKLGDRYFNIRLGKSKSPVIEHNAYFTWQVENNPEWFKPKEEEKVRNREIKFRAWNKTNKIMHPFINSADNWSFSFIDQSIFTWLQYTGLNDKNGEEIYEGDIVRFVRPSTYPNFYEIPMRINFNPIMGFHPYIQGIGHYDDWQYHLSEVLGNIYEHPELLNQIKQ